MENVGQQQVGHPITNSTSSEQSNARTGWVPIPVLVIFAILATLVSAFIALYLFIRFRHRIAGSDLESAKAVQKDAIGLKTFNSATPVQKYKQSKAQERHLTWGSSQSASADVCAVCLEVLVDKDEVRRLKCNHVFHKSCIDLWFMGRHYDCPLCKTIYVAKPK